MLELTMQWLWEEWAICSHGVMVSLDALVLVTLGTNWCQLYAHSLPVREWLMQHVVRTSLSSLLRWREILLKRWKSRSRLAHSILCNFVSKSLVDCPASRVPHMQSKISWSLTEKLYLVVRTYLNKWLTRSKKLSITINSVEMEGWPCSMIVTQAIPSLQIQTLTCTNNRTVCLQFAKPCQESPQ